MGQRMLHGADEYSSLNNILLLTAVPDPGCEVFIRLEIEAILAKHIVLDESSLDRGSPRALAEALGNAHSLHQTKSDSRSQLLDHNALALCALAVAASEQISEVSVSKGASRVLFDMILDTRASVGNSPWIVVISVGIHPDDTEK